ncbi:Trihelix transcription factor GT-4 like [Actinidia chinensis var. chinensis]|uniref:Trihelix transcription factor GT-4 like n=1 Tax=Actinidia chinensis var. chinensis TaxID=1590841 RepID=A0A2R6PDM9_ACTCC|nr:Trihelix transcription factor GT-4 like [Actinidia chinensis var. chinensis]
MLDEMPQNNSGTFNASNASPLINLLNEGMTNMLIESEPNSESVPQPISPSENGSKRRAQTWDLDEIQCLLSLRRELHCQFNTTNKSNKHLWDRISRGMRGRGWERTPSMCIDKWRNLLKGYKKAMNQNGGSGEVSYEELKEYCRDKKSNGSSKKSRAAASDRMVDKDNGKPLNSEKSPNHDASPVDIPEHEGLVPNEIPSWIWEGTPKWDGENPASGGRIISVRWGENVKKIGINGSAEGIQEAIKSAFSLRTKRLFWLEDEDGIVQTLDRNMPLGYYTLHVDDGISVRICIYDGPNHNQCRTVEKTFYTEDAFYDYLSRRGWIGLRDSSKNIDSIENLHPGKLYHGLTMQKN